MTDTNIAAPEAAKPATAEFTLEEPIRRGDVKIDKIVLRKPKAAELRGLSLQALLQLDVNSVITVLPRISTPTLTPAEAESLDAVDLAAAGGAIYGFFMSRQERTAIAKVMGAVETELSSD